MGTNVAVFWFPLVPVAVATTKLQAHVVGLPSDVDPLKVQSRFPPDPTTILQISAPWAFDTVKRAITDLIPTRSVPSTFWWRAPIVASPTAPPVTRPVVETFAIVVLLVVHVAEFVTFCVEPFDSVAMAVSWSVWPGTVLTLVPVTATDVTVVGCVGVSSPHEGSAMATHTHRSPDLAHSRS